ncbi:MAG: peptidoglycan binding domain-containing protein, partial [Acidimicrobiia bacterium]|nr:peptidoglycan binding domain-containing protein [Acidimicrobiia bacterium]
MPRHARSPRTRRLLLTIGAPLLVVVALVGAWGIDTATGGAVVRNVEVDGVDVGRTDDPGLQAALERYATDLAARSVEVVTPTGTYTTTAGELGLGVDIEATASRARETGRGFTLVRPVSWLLSLLSPHQVEPVLTVDRDATATTMVALQADARQDPIEPTIQLAEDGTVVLVAGIPGSGIDRDDVADQLPGAALGGADPIVVRATPEVIPPSVDDATVQAVADDANARTAAPLN